MGTGYSGCSGTLRFSGVFRPSVDRTQRTASLLWMWHVVLFSFAVDRTQCAVSLLGDVQFFLFCGLGLWESNKATRLGRVALFGMGLVYVWYEVWIGGVWDFSIRFCRFWCAKC